MAITFTNITKVFQQNTNGFGTRSIQALMPVEFDIKTGEFFCIIGPSGCGKSTLLNVLAGLEKPDSGEVAVDGVAVTGPGPDRAVVFQEAGLMPWMTVSKNVEYGLKLQGLSKDERKEKAELYLRMVHLVKYANSLPHQLSGGMRQRVSLSLIHI